MASALLRRRFPSGHARILLAFVGIPERSNDAVSPKLDARGSAGGRRRRNSCERAGAKAPQTRDLSSGN